MTPFLAFALWLVACWIVAVLTERPLQPPQIEDDLADVNTCDLHRLREMHEAEARQWDELGSGVVSRAVRLRHIRRA